MRPTLCAHCQLRRIAKGIRRHCQRCYMTVPNKFLDHKHGEQVPGPVMGSVLDEVCELPCLA